MMTEATAELIIRSVGGGLQVLGFVIAAAGITAARRRWDPDLPGILGSLGRVVDRFLGRAEQHSGGSMAAVIIDAVGAGDSASQSGESAPSLEQRVEALEARMDRHAEQLQSLQRGLTREVEDREAGDKSERAAREQGEHRHEQQLVELATGDLRQETWGVALFLLGLVLVTWSSEVALLGS